MSFIFLLLFFATKRNFPENTANICFKTFHLVFDPQIQMAVFVHVFFFNPLKIDRFIIKEGKYPNICYNGFLIPLASDNISFYKTLPRCMYVKTLLVVPDLLFKRLIFAKYPFCCSLPSLGSKENRQKGWGIAESLKFPKKSFFLAFCPHKRKLAAVSNFSVTSCLLKALKTE